MEHEYQIAMDLIKKFEGLSLKAYPDPATKGAPYTIGYGQTAPYINANSFWTISRAEIMLEIAVDRLARLIKKEMPSLDLNINQLSSMISFAYNEGMGNLMKVIHEVGIQGYPIKILEYDKAAGIKMAGLTNRRIIESNLFRKFV